MTSDTTFLKGSTNNESSRIEEFEFSIHVEHLDKKYPYIKRELSKYFNEKSFLQNQTGPIERYENVVYLMIKQNFDNRFKFIGDSKAYLSNYEERSGSLIISFTILVAYAIVNYGGIRESIDYFAKDLQFLFDNGGQTKFRTSVNYRATGRFQRQDPSQESTLEQLRLKRQIFINRGLAGIALFMTILVSSTLFFEEPDSNSDVITKPEIELLILREMQRVNSNPILTPTQSVLEVDSTNNM